MPIDPKSAMPQPVPVKFKDGHTETVFIKQLELVERYKFLFMVAEYKTPEMVALCAGRPLSWLNTIDDDSDCYAELVRECYRLNFQKALKLLKNDLPAGARLGNLLERLTEIGKVMERVSASDIAPGSSASPSAQQPVESAAETSPGLSGSAPTTSSPS